MLLVFSGGLYEEVEANVTVKTSSSLTLPADTDYVLLQANTHPIRYTMDNVTNPTQTSGMVLLPTEPTAKFSVEDVQRIRFTRGASYNAILGVYYSYNQEGVKWIR